MTQKSFATLLIVVLLSSMTLWIYMPQSITASPATLKVPDEYPTIQAAIDAASAGDIVLVAASTYNENLVINKSLTITGESKDTTIIDGGNVDYVLNISNTNNVKVTRFTIQNAAKAVVYLEGTNNSTISDTIIQNGTESGIYLKESNNCLVSHDTVLFTKWGVRLDRYSQSNTISRNTMQNHTETGIYLEGADNNTVSRNVVVWNGYEKAGFFSAGIYLDYGAKYNRINQNNVTLNNWHGIYLVFSNNNTIEGNTVSKNLRAGIVLSSSNNSAIYENELFENSFGVQMFGPLSGHILYRNNFIQNAVQLDLNEASGIVWDNGAEGNYWSDYAGEDLDGDGVGETLTPHLGVDGRPLMESWGLFRVFDAYVWGTVTYRIATYCNSTVASFDYNHTLKQVRFNVTGPSGAFGFCNVTIPRGLTRSPWLVLIDEANVTAGALIVSNVTHTSLDFNYTFSTHRVKIMGTGGLDVTPPIAEAGSDQTIDEDTVFTFDGSGSTDDIGIVSYTWAFIDVTPKNLAGVQPTYTFENPGVYSVMLNVTDVAANWATDNVTITVRDVTPPIANAGSDQTVTVGTEVTFNASLSSDNVDIVTYEWNFGDETTLQTGITTTHIYTKVGTYVVTLTVKDAAENADTDSLIVTVVETPLQWWSWIVIAIILIGTLTATYYFIAKRRRQVVKTSNLSQERIS